MDEETPQKTPTSTHTTINQTEAKPTGGNGVMWFLLGGVVVVVAIIAYFLLGNGAMPTLGSSEPTGGNVSINVESTGTPANEADPAEAAPAETAPEDAPPAE
jgi:hypothetical protein